MSTNSLQSNALPIEAGTWKVDTAHTQLGFAVRHLGISTVRGIFRTFDGSVVVDESTAQIEVSAELASVDSGNQGRDEHLQGDHFFDTANHPQLMFRATSIELANENSGVINGDLTIRGITKPVTLNAVFNGTGTFPVDNSLHAGFEASGSFNRTDFGVNFGVPMVSDEVQLDLQVQLIRQ
jgi:polyisoprenoid-binding protein YceI